MEKIKWAVCDDAFYSCYIYVSKLESIEALESVGHCLKSADLPDLIRTKEPDVLLLDIQMESTTSGIDIIPIIKTIKPDLKIIMLTGYDNEDYIYQAFANGADNYLLKDISLAEQIASTIMDVYQGTAHVPTGIAKRLANKTKRVETGMQSLLYMFEIMTKLSPSEYDILKTLYNGESYKQIASSRFITDSTLRNHISRILKKFKSPSMKALLPALQELHVFEYLH